MEYLVELESDFSRFHGVSDIYEMHSVQFFNWTYYISQYRGAMTARVEQDQERKKPASQKQQSTSPSKTSSGNGQKYESNVFMAMHSEYFDVVKAAV